MFMQEGQCVFQERGPTWLMVYQWCINGVSLVYHWCIIGVSLVYCFIVWLLIYHVFIDVCFVHAGRGSMFSSGARANVVIGLLFIY